MVDPRSNTITVLRLVGEAYQLHGQYGTGDTATSATLTQLSVPVSAVFEAQ